MCIVHVDIARVTTTVHNDNLSIHLPLSQDQIRKKRRKPPLKLLDIDAVRLVWDMDHVLFVFGGVVVSFTLIFCQIS